MILPPADADQSPAQSEALVERVMTEFRHGLLSDHQLAALLPRLRWRDATGGRFTLGVQSRRWYAWDGRGWVPTAPARLLRLDADPEPEPVVDVRTPLEDEPEAEPETAPRRPQETPTSRPVGGPGWTPTHRIPPGGLPVFTESDGWSAAPVAAGVPVRVVDTTGTWTRIQDAHGWSAWVDGRGLVPLAGGQAAADPAGGREAGL